MPVNIERGVTITSGVTISAPPAPPFTLRIAPAQTSTVSIQISGNGNINTTINWGDGNSNFYSSGTTANKVYSAGTYDIQITGNANTVNYLGNRPVYLDQTLQSITSWGNLPLRSINFERCANLTSVPNTLPSTITSLANTFFACENLNDSNISNWNVSNVTNMSNLFNSAYSFNQNIGGWNMSMYRLL